MKYYQEPSYDNCENCHFNEEFRAYQRAKSTKQSTHNPCFRRREIHGIEICFKTFPIPPEEVIR